MSAQPNHKPVTYFAIFGALLVLTFTTVVLSGVELGAWEIPVTLGIASTKAVLVVLFFMHLLDSPRLTWVIASSGLLFVAILLALTLSDYWMRGSVPTRPGPGPAQQVVGAE